MQRRAWPCLGAILGIWLGFPHDFEPILRLPPLALLWPGCLALLGLAAQSLPRAFLAGWCVCAAGFACSLYWLCLPLRQVGQLPWAAAIACALCIAAILALAPAFFCLGAWSWRKSPPPLFCLRLALLWYLQEETAAHLFGVPWLPLAGALIQWPLLIQAADTLGAYGAGALWVLATLPAFLALRSRGAEAGKKLLFSALATALLLGYGAFRLWQTPYDPDPRGEGSFASLLVEGNVDQGEKWLPRFQRATVRLYARLTREGLAKAGPGRRAPLVIWPETSLPFLFEKNAELASMVREAVRGFDAPLLFGAPGVGGSPERIYNRAYLMAPDGRLAGAYDKEHLVPFGEYAPPWLNWPLLEPLLQGVGIYSEGESSDPLRLDGLALGMLICYEGIFPWLAQARVEDGANVLADISNDGWFGRSPAARQHLYLTALRPLEQGRWLLRGTNTGISAVIDSRGRISARGPQFQAGSVAARAAALEGTSAFHRLAPWLAPAAAICLLALCLPTGRRNKAGRGKTLL